jgi:hypothetical protein
MPVKPCTKNGKKGFKWGDSGTCYTYTANDPASREQAKKKAIAQGRAIKANQ